MDDRSEIVELLNRYAYAYDRQDVDLLATCYSNDAVFRAVSPSGVAREFAGRDAILGNARATFAAVTWGRRHIVTNHLVRLDGGSASSVCYLQLIDAVDAGASVIALTGTYDDELVRVDDDWRIRRRTLTTDSEFTLRRTGA